MKLQTGDRVPEIKAESYRFDSVSEKVVVEQWSLAEAVKKSPILFIFYPGDFTAVCTKQLCDYRDNWHQLGKLPVEIVGISLDSGKKHSDFAAQFKLPMRLLNDSAGGASGHITDLFGMKLFGLPMANRGFILVGKDQRIKYIFREVLPIFRRSAAEVVALLKAYL